MASPGSRDLLTTFSALEVSEKTSVCVCVCVFLFCLDRANRLTNEKTSVCTWGCSWCFARDECPPPSPGGLCSHVMCVLACVLVFVCGWGALPFWDYHVPRFPVGRPGSGRVRVAFAVATKRKAKGMSVSPVVVCACRVLVEKKRCPCVQPLLLSCQRASKRGWQEGPLVRHAKGVILAACTVPNPCGVPPPRYYVCLVCTCSVSNSGRVSPSTSTPYLLGAMSQVMGSVFFFCLTLPLFAPCFVAFFRPKHPSVTPPDDARSATTKGPKLGALDLPGSAGASSSIGVGGG